MKHLDPLVLAKHTLDGALSDEARAHVEACETCRRALHTAQGDAEHFAEVVFPRSIASIRDRLAPRPWWRRPSFALAVAASAAVLAVVVPRWTTPDGASVVTTKGDPSFAVVVRRDEGAVRVKDGDVLRAEDRIRFLAQGAGHSYVLVVSVDGAGGVSVYFPFDGSASGRIDDAHPELPGSVILDGTEGPERLFALFSKTPLDAREIRARLEAIGREGHAAIRATRRLDGVGGTQATILIEKETR